MEKEKKYKTIIGILVTIVIILIIAFMYVLLINKNGQGENKEENKEEIKDTYSKIDENKGLYYEIKGNKYDLYAQFNNKKTLSNVTLNLTYPVININTEDGKRINSYLKNQYFDLLDDVKKFNENGCVCAQIDNNYYCGDHMPLPSYDVINDDEVLTMIFTKRYYTECAGGSSVDTMYKISKKTGKEVTDEDILNLFNYNQQDIKAKLTSFLNEKFDYDFTTEINGASYTIKDGKLIIGVGLIDSHDYIIYDGKNFSEANYQNLFE